MILTLLLPIHLNNTQNIHILTILKSSWGFERAKIIDQFDVISVLSSMSNKHDEESANYHSATISTNT